LTWAFQVGSSRYVTASPSEFAGAVGFITSRLSRLESDYLTNKLAQKLDLGITVVYGIVYHSKELNFNNG